MSNGYSKRPLVEKLGIKKGFKIRLIDVPMDYFDLLGYLPEEVEILENKKSKANFIHLFCENKSSFDKKFLKLKDEIERDGMIWISWYKKSAKIPTDLQADIIRTTGLSLGLVDVKVCAIDEKWSGLKFVWRKENR